MRKINQLPNLEELRVYLKVDPLSPSGLTWIKSYTNRVKVNSVAGSKGKYWTINFKGKSYAVHRIIYFMYYEIDPKDFDIDHKDQNRLNNNPNNLRLATRQLNNANTKSAKGSTSKYKGVHFSKRLNKWIAGITKNYKQIHLGVFETETEAALEYNKHAQILYGDYAFLNTIDDNS